MNLLSPEEVRAMFPENRRPALKRLIAKAKEAGCCCKLGRGIGFTPEQVQTFLGYLTCSGSRNTPSVRRTGSSVVPSPGSSYLKAPKSRDVPCRKKQRKQPIYRTDTAHLAWFVPVSVSAFHKIRAFPVNPRRTSND